MGSFFSDVIRADHNVRGKLPLNPEGPGLFPLRGAVRGRNTQRTVRPEAHIVRSTKGTPRGLIRSAREGIAQVQEVVIRSLLYEVITLVYSSKPALPQGTTPLAPDRDWP